MLVYTDTSYAIRKALTDQLHRDEGISSLLATMVDIYQFVMDANPLEAAERLQTKSRKRVIKVLTAMVLQTTECGYFISAYAKQKSFCTSLSLCFVSLKLTVVNFRDQGHQA